MVKLFIEFLRLHELLSTEVRIFLFNWLEITIIGIKVSEKPTK